MRAKAYALLAVGAWGLVSCSRTELWQLDSEKTGPDAGGAGAMTAGGTAGTTSGNHPCQWTFAPEMSYAIAGDTGPIAIGDFNGDRVPDILTLNSAYNQIDLLLNLGTGTFAQASGFPSGGILPTGLAVSDFSGDGSLDLAVIYDYQAAGGTHAVNVFLNRGNGTFAPPASYQINGGGFDIAAGDFNGDGHADLAVIDAQATVSVLMNDGDGTFGPAAAYDAGPAAGYVTTADFDRDGTRDIAIAGTFSTSVLFNQGYRAFAAPVTYQNSTACDDIGPLIAADVNGDGYPDIIRSCYQGADAVAVRSNEGNRRFGAEVNYGTGSWPTQLVVGDFLGHGQADLAVANSGAGTVSVLPNIGGGTFGTQAIYHVTAPYFIAAGDLNGDGHEDLVTAGANPVAPTAGSAVDVLLSVCK